MTVRARLSVLGLIVLSALCLAFAALGAGAERGTLVTIAPSPPATPQEDPVPPPTIEVGPTDDPLEQWQPSTSAGGDGSLLRWLLILLAVVAAVGIGWLAVRILQRARALPSTAASEAEELVGDDELSEEQARAALDVARRTLDTIVEAQGAVIAAWLTLEESIAEAGLQRGSSQTTFEFVSAVLGAHALDVSAVRRLAALYQRALFDDAPLTDHDRSEAIALLDALMAQLDQQAEAAPQPGRSST
jgi:hypothetical protein